MKKLFYVLVAVATLSLASCGNKPVEPKEEEAGIKVEATSHDVVAKITITPNDDKTPYLVGLYTDEYMDGVAEADYADSLLSWTLQTIEYYKYVYEYFGYEYDGTLEDFTYTGVLTEEAGYDENTHYTVIAAYVNLDSVTVKKAAFATFETTKMPISSNKIGLNYNEETGLLEITTTNNDPYYVMILDETNYEYYANSYDSDAEILSEDLEYQIEYNNYQWAAEDFLFAGNYNYDFVADYGGFDAGTLVALAGTYYYGFINSEVAKITFEYAGGEEEDEAPYQAPAVKKIKNNLQTKALKIKKINTK